MTATGSQRPGIIFGAILTIPLAFSFSAARAEEGGKTSSSGPIPVVSVPSPAGEEIRIYTELVKQNPKDPDAYYRLASAYYRNGAYLQAEENFQKTIEINSEDVEAWLFLGLSRVFMGQQVKGMEALETALSKRPNDPRIQSYHCQAMAELGNLGEAADCFKKSLEKNSTQCTLWIQLGRVYKRMRTPESYKEAEAALKRAAQECPKQYEPFDELGLFYYFQSRFQDASNAYCQAFERNPDPKYRNHQLDSLRDISKVSPFTVPCLKPGEEEGFRPVKP